MRSEPIDIRDRGPYSVDQFRVKDDYKDDLECLLISEGEIDSRITCLADEITHAFGGRGDVEVYAMCVLKGAMQFFGALTPQLDLDVPVNEGAIKASRYSSGETITEEAEIEWLDEELIEGRDILVVEDIVDEGYTLQSVRNQLEEFNPNSVDVAVLFDKRTRRKVDVPVDYTGFVIPDEFVVGYGLDYDERYRDLRHLAVLNESARND